MLTFVLSVALIVTASVGVSRSWAAIPKSDDLSKFVTDVSISGISADSQGVYQYRDGDEATLRFTFAENDNIQFGDSQLTYVLPAGFDAVNASGTFDVPVLESGVMHTVRGNKWEIRNGALIITWNTDDSNIEHLRDSANARIVLGIKFTLHGVNGMVKFGDGVERTFALDTSNDLSTTKSSVYDEAAGKIHYTATVKSTGISTGVTTTDTIAGNAIAYDPSSLRIAGNSGTYSVQTQGNGFVLSVPTMANGETITLTYDGIIDYSAFHGSVTADNASNTLTATSNGDSNPSNNTVTTDDSHTIALSDVSKSGTAESSSQSSGSSRTVHWTIDSNSKRHVSLAGGTIKDSIAQYSQSRMSYAGDGITITVTDASGTQIATRKVSWADLGVTDPSSDKAWTYAVPSTDGVYSYHIAYDTTVDMTGALSDLTVANSATSASVQSGTQSTNAYVGIGTQFSLETHKTAVANESDYHHTVWSIDASVPATGYNSLMVTDNLPSTWGTVTDSSGASVSRQLYDAYVDGSLSVTGLEAGESYTVDASDPSKVVITFYADTAHTIPGLSATSTARTIAIKLTTQNNDDWLAIGKNGGWQATHTNNETVTANGQSKSASASVTPMQQSITKQSEYMGTRNVNGVDLPVYKFTLTLEGVNSDDFDISDDFDASLFSFATTDQVGMWGQNKVFGGDQYYQGQEGSAPITWSETSSGAIIHVSSGAIAKNNGAYYSRYKIWYCLIAKDANAVSTLNQRATDNNGTTTFTNTATWNGNSSGSIVSTYTYRMVNKEQTSVDPQKRTATFRITLNPASTDINPYGDTLILTDTMSSNMALDVNSLQTTPTDGVSFQLDSQTNTLSVTFPDKTPVTLTYTVYLKGSGYITYSNKASLHGQTSSIESSTNVSSESSSGASVPSIRLLKNDSGDLTKPLPGAHFKLYKADDDSSPVTENEFVSGSDGIVTVTGRQDRDGWSLHPGTKYYLKETAAPSGYSLRSDPIYFTISDSPTGEDEYPDSYTIPWVNTPVSNSTSFTLRKVDEINNSTVLAGAQFTLTGTNADGVSTTSSVVTAADGMASFTGVTPGTYTLKETRAPNGYEASDVEHSVVVLSTLAITYDGQAIAQETDGTASITVQNHKKQFFLPNTGRFGGMWAFAGAGGITMLLGSTVALAETGKAPRHGSRRSGKHPRRDSRR
ncbi:SpaA isopeptide-forming pilin-related protein [Pseudoscardovia suis]|uniref:SpaA isopeptide-forming pilin-related protein n=1 Tax=Pseudoscardovia suis TaxID=987063 RepID=UPI000B9B8F94|nr:SpaA isopeptide-forming pilin-related protein [Pseudoscardovia suis]